MMLKQTSLKSKWFTVANIYFLLTLHEGYKLAVALLSLTVIYVSSYSSSQAEGQPLSGHVAIITESTCSGRNTASSHKNVQYYVHPRAISQSE